MHQTNLLSKNPNDKPGLTNYKPDPVNHKFFLLPKKGFRNFKPLLPENRPLMFRSLLILFCALAFLRVGFGQDVEITGRVFDGENDKPLPFVNISQNGSNVGATTDLDGRFSLNVEPSENAVLLFSYIGYEAKEVQLSGTEEHLRIYLTEKPAALDEVTVFPGENPAHRIIENAVRNREQNDPENLETFSYKAYSKFVATINTDSIKSLFDTTYHPAYQDSIVEIDSAKYKMVQLMQRQHLFFMENLSERKFIKGRRDNEKVLATKTSGFNDPLFSLLGTELQSFSFYDNYISIAGQDLLNPLTPGSTGRYFFLLEDTAYNAVDDTVFIISFRPRPNRGFRAMKGVLYINSSAWAVQNVLAGPAEAEDMEVEIEQKYRRYEDAWFPDQLHARIFFRNIKVNSSYPQATMRTYLQDVKIGEELRRKDISRALVTIEDDAIDRAPELLHRYRIDSLDSREKFTYHFMDSVNEAENLDQKLKFYKALIQGRLAISWFDLILDKIISFNEYEGIRLGAGAETNDKVSKWFTLGAYYGYGFKDKASKYGAYTDVTLNKAYNLHWFAGYKYDLFETGGVDFISRVDRGLFSDNYRQLFIPQWDEGSRIYSGFTYDPLGTVHMRLSGRHEERHIIGSYSFAPTAEEGAADHFRFFEVIASMRYAPQEEYVEGPFGRMHLQQAFPQMYFQYTRGLEDVQGSQFSYDKIDLRFDHRFHTVFFGEPSFEIQAGTVLQDIPYSKLYVGRANLKNSGDLSARWGVIADRNSFETMFFNEFLSDTYVHLMWRQDFKSILFRRGDFAPHVELVARALWGSLRSPEVHREIDFKVPRQGFYESGVELNRLYVSDFSNLGLGFYFRLGPYMNPQFIDNFAVKLTSKFTL